VKEFKLYEIRGGKENFLTMLITSHIHAAAREQTMRDAHKNHDSLFN
jgi:hypothetical protein